LRQVADAHDADAAEKEDEGAAYAEDQFAGGSAAERLRWHVANRLHHQ
jgi:hypothetical protein